MYWFSKERGFKPKLTTEQELEGDGNFRYSRWLDFSTAGYADPKADPGGVGKTNLKSYLDQTDPTAGPPPTGPGGGVGDGADGLKLD